MTTTTPHVLILGGTGKTGSRLATKLTDLGLVARTAARHGADVRFDWDDPATYRPALRGVDRVYLVTPILRDASFTDRVSSFLDLAAGHGARHVTYLSAYGIDQAPPQVALRAVELGVQPRYGQKPPSVGL
jgi:uncharacterized protein YbjT (DUF2867 family)